MSRSSLQHNSVIVPRISGGILHNIACAELDASKLVNKISFKVDATNSAEFLVCNLGAVMNMSSAQCSFKFGALAWEDVWRGGWKFPYGTVFSPLEPVPAY